jgi:hypothetical protein
MPDYFNVKNSTYTPNRFLSILPIVPILLLRTKGTIIPHTSTVSSSASSIASDSIQAEQTETASQTQSILSSIGSIFSGSNALDILSSVEPYLPSNHQQLIGAIKGFNSSFEKLKSFRTTQPSASVASESTDSLNVLKALSTNLNPEMKHSISPILNLVSTIKGIQSTAPALQNMLSPNGLVQTLANFSSMIPQNNNIASGETSMDHGADNGLAGIADLVKMFTTINSLKTDALFSPESSSDITNDDSPKLLEPVTDTNDDSLSDMADKLQSIINKN